MELKECRLRLAEERVARLKAESRLTEVSWPAVVSSQNVFLPMYLDKLPNEVYADAVLVHPVVYQSPHPPYLSSF